MASSLAYVCQTSYNEPTDIPSYYTEYEEWDGSPSGAGGKGDGCSLYRAIARVVRGDQALWSSVRDVVYAFVLRVHGSKEHPFHRGLSEVQQKLYSIRGSTLPALIERPDIDPDNRVLRVIARALNIRICIFRCIAKDGQAQNFRLDVCSSSAQLCVLVQKPHTTFVTWRFSSLMPDRSGKALVKLLCETRDQGLNELALPMEQQALKGMRLGQMTWSFDTDEAGKAQVSSHNAFRQASSIDDLKACPELQRLDVFVANISDPLQIVPAIGLITKALEVAFKHQQRIQVGPGCEQGVMRPYVAMDGEFHLKSKQPIGGKTQAEISSMKAWGEAENLCSVLTVAVDSKFVVHFNLLEMLENANEHTVAAVEYLFR